jgi:Na+/phosphate symporter
MDERDEAREKATELAQQNAELSRRVTELETAEAVSLEQVKEALAQISHEGLPEGEGPIGLGLIGKAIEATEARAQAARQQELALNEEEQEAMDAILAAIKIIMNRWKLMTNTGELTAAAHVLQSFVFQHMAHRLAPERFKSWWAQGKETSDEVR